MADTDLPKRFEAFVTQQPERGMGWTRINVWDEHHTPHFGMVVYQNDKGGYSIKDFTGTVTQVGVSHNL